jgi:hypothetical protein
MPVPAPGHRGEGRRRRPRRRCRGARRRQGRVGPRIRLPVLAEVPLMFCDPFQLSPPIHNCQESEYDKKPMECGRGVVQVAYQRGNQ